MAGVLNDDWLELIDGYLLMTMGRNPPRRWATREFLDRLAQTLPPS
jgi:hypothetical protein